MEDNDKPRLVRNNEFNKPMDVGARIAADMIALFEGHIDQQRKRAKLNRAFVRILENVWLAIFWMSIGSLAFIHFTK